MINKLRIVIFLLEYSFGNRKGIIWFFSVIVNKEGSGFSKYSLNFCFEVFVGFFYFFFKLELNSFWILDSGVISLNFCMFDREKIVFRIFFVKFKDFIILFGFL